MDTLNSIGGCDDDTVKEDLVDKYRKFFLTASGDEYTGDILNGKPHGKGRHCVAGDNGYVYEGDFVDGERNGELGICVCANGEVYTGSWLHDKRHGQGELLLSKNPTTVMRIHQLCHPRPVTYRGNFQNNLPQGMGEFKYIDGSHYRGECDGYWRHGEGEHHTARGEVFSGFFQKNRRHGKGVLQSSAGKYRGEWIDDVLEGHAIFEANMNAVSPAGLVFYEGPFRGGKMTGVSAVAKYRDGSVYSGEMLAGKANGKGILEGMPMSISRVGMGILQYNGDFVAGVAKGSGIGTFTVTTPNPNLAPLTLPSDVRVYFPRFDVSGQYTGTWERGLPNGNGEWVWDNGQRYVGDVKDGLPHGSGLLVGPEVHYKGSFSAGFPDGDGKITWKISDEKNDTYDGTWKEGYLDGDGTLTLHDGSTYTGGWKNGLREKSGVDYVPNQYKYEGEFQCGKHHGRGMLFSESRDIMYEGDFVASEMTGTGRMTLRDGTVIMGGFLNGKLHGKVEMSLTDGRLLEAEFRSNALCGPGTVLYPNGDKYHGGLTKSNEFVPVRHGKGVYRFSEGGELECSWERDVLHGQGVYTSVTGAKSKRSYIDGVLWDASSSSTDAMISQTESTSYPSESSTAEQPSCNTQQLPVLVRRTLPRCSSNRGAVRPPHLRRFQSGIAGGVVPLIEINDVPFSQLKGVEAPLQRDPLQASVSSSFGLNVSRTPIPVIYSSSMCILRRRDGGTVDHNNKLSNRCNDSESISNNFLLRLQKK